MIPEPQHAPRLFEGTALHYASYRFGYPDDVFDYLVDRFSLSGATNVLDLGCGTGQIAIPLARRGVAVRAVDPDVDMLGEAMRVEGDPGGIAVAWQRGDDQSLERLAMPALTLCTMGASFHWTDRDLLLEKLDTLIVESGAVVLLDGGRGSWMDGAGDWGEVAKEVIAEFLGSERRAGAGVYNHPKDRHEIVLARSAFSAVERKTFVVPKVLSIDDIIGLQLSTSYASPAQLGDKIDAFCSSLRNRLVEIAPDGLFRGEICHEMLIGTRSRIA
jgi:SAM-dependent methyltransferase